MGKFLDYIIASIVVIGTVIIYLGGGLLHIYTTYLLGKTQGFWSAVWGFCFPFASEIYSSFKFGFQYNYLTYILIYIISFIVTLIFMYDTEK